MFHYFHDDGNKYKKVDGSLSFEDLEAIILNDEYKVLDFDVWLNKFFSDSLAENETCLTFDDGIKEQYDVAVKVLDKHNVQGLFGFCSMYFNGDQDSFEIYRYYRNYFFEKIDDYYDAYFSFLLNNEHYKNLYLLTIDNVNFDEYLSHATFYSTQDRKFRYFRDIVFRDEHVKIMDKMIEQSGINVNEMAERLWISQEELSEISKNHVIAIHSHEHPTTIDSWSYEEQLLSYSINKKILEENIGRTIDCSVYPCGKYNENTQLVLESLGIRAGFIASQTQPIDSNFPFLIPRIDSTDFCKLIGIK